jgi:dihydroorotate dehydrogenase electron transfer subunit
MPEGSTISVSLLREIKTLADETVLIAITRPGDMTDPLPGQFAKLKILNFGQQDSSLRPAQPLIDRPFSFHKSENGLLYFLIRQAGQTTGLFRHLLPGAAIKITGPLGRICPELTHGNGHLVMVAGGAGMGPMGMLRNRGFSRLTLLYGERSASSQMDRDYLLTFADNFKAVTEDGSGYGDKGLVTQALRDCLISQDEPPTVFACGPTGLLKESERICLDLGISIFISAEAFMACGLGICLTCSQTTTSQKRVRLCMDGPVFPGKTLILP